MIANTTLSYPSVKTRLEKHGENKFSIVIEPLLPGFGHTLGNSLRRVLLSSIPGFAVTRVKINDITHEYQPIKGVVEDALEVILNLKQLRTRFNTDDESVTLILKKTGEGQIFARDFEKNAKVEITNPDLFICSLDKSGSIDIEVEISHGFGYKTIEEAKLAASPSPYYIYTDSLFSPLTNVSLDVDQVRVGDKTNFDKAIVTFETDGSVTGEEIADYGLKLTLDLFNNIYSSFQAGLGSTTISSSFEDATVSALDDIDLPKKIKSILEKNGITSLADLQARIEEVETFAGITEKSFESIKEYLASV